MKVEMRYYTHPSMKLMGQDQKEISVVGVTVLQYRQQYNGFQGGYEPGQTIPFVPMWGDWIDVPSVSG